MAERNEEEWDIWATRLRTDPASPVRKMMRAGIKEDTAFIILMLQRVYDELLDIEDVLRAPEEKEW